MCSFGFRRLIHPFSGAGLVQALLTQNHADERFSSDNEHLWACCFMISPMKCANNLFKLPVKRKLTEEFKRVVKPLLHVYFTDLLLTAFPLY